MLGFPYWTRFNEMRVESKQLPRFENAGPRFFHRYFLVNPSKRNGKRNIHYEGRIKINPKQVSMRLIFKTADNIKELFGLIAQDRDAVENEIGFPLRWLRDRGRYNRISPLSKMTWILAIPADGIDSTHGFQKSYRLSRRRSGRVSRNSPRSGLEPSVKRHAPARLCSPAPTR